MYKNIIKNVFFLLMVLFFCQLFAQENQNSVNHVFGNVDPVNNTNAVTVHPEQQKIQKNFSGLGQKKTPSLKVDETDINSNCNDVTRECTFKPQVNQKKYQNQKSNQWVIQPSNNVNLEVQK